jgi:RNA polymerase sigma-70 factor (ECF subfamily)
MHLCRNKEDAEDLLQETYLRALSSQIKHSNTRAWLRTIMRNLFISNRRQQKSFKTIRIGDPLLFENWMQKYPSPEINFALLECMEKINSLRFRDTFLMHLDGYMYKEIADIQNQMEQTIKIRIHRARKQLRKYAD